METRKNKVDSGFPTESLRQASASSSLEEQLDTRSTIEKWVRYRLLQSGYCDVGGSQISPVNLESFRTLCLKDLPNGYTEIVTAIKTIEEEFTAAICQDFPTTAEGRFRDIYLVVKRLREMRLEYGKKRAEAIVRSWEIQNISKLQGKTLAPKYMTRAVVQGMNSQENLGPKQTSNAAPPIKGSLQPSSQKNDRALDEWVYQQFLEHGFSKSGFKGFAKLTQMMTTVRPKQKQEIIVTVAKLRKPGQEFSFGKPESLFSAMAAERRKKSRPQSEGGIQLLQSVPDHPFSTAAIAGSSALSQLVPESTSLLAEIPPNPYTAKLLALHQHMLVPTGLSAKMPPDVSNANPVDLTQHVPLPTKPSTGATSSISTIHETNKNSLLPSRFELQELPGNEHMECASVGQEHYHPPDDPDYDHIDLLMPDADSHDGPEELFKGSDAEIQHAPLISGDMITKEHKHLLPQYGALGMILPERSRLFLNTNIPFSAFICGVQGSGKSHTTSCLLENVLIPSKYLGRLESPLSALVFSYGQFSGDGSGFNISEVASLAAAHPSLPGHPYVRKLTVLVSPSNPGIARLYQKIPNVTVTPYKLKPWNLDVDIMLTLMAVHESSEQPLYLAQVTNILRDMATHGNGKFDYMAFKNRLRECNFNPAQTNMLQLRLDLLESFLDLEDNCPEPQFQPGEITIMDMSCPFVDANTACILFKIGLGRYLQSKAPGKMIVLDEAHKYMLKNPGAVSLNSYLLQVIRLQRHFGARVVISTQEPTLLTDLIALCSITVVHRFSSPEWFSALKKHIPMSGHDHEKLLQDIETLKTGTALVYSSAAVLGKNEDGTLTKGTGKMIKIGVRMRVTSDGGQSVLAV